MCEPDYCREWRTPDSGDSGSPFHVYAQSGSSHLRSEVSPSNAGLALTENHPVTELSLDRAALRRSDGITCSDYFGSTEAHYSNLPVWLQQTLLGWTNPVFPTAKRPIPSVEVSRPKESYQSDGAASKFSHQIGKESLRSLCFLEQIDQKFLLCRLTDPQRDLLVLVDQHAADERIRVESLFRHFCRQVEEGEVEMLEFDEMKPILVSSIEAEQIQERLGDFARWGFGLESNQAVHKSELAQINVRAVPAIVADRLKADMRLIQQLIKSYLAQLPGFPPAHTLQAKRSWVSVVRQCPEVLVDLINSKACRGALWPSRARSSDVVAQDL